MVASLLFLTSGLFMGWSLGANDAANIFGTAVATKMIKFRTAAIICSIFIILGAVISGAGAADTYGELGDINAMAGAFVVALAAAFTVLWMTRAGLPVSTSQAIVGAIVGWNLYAGYSTDIGALSRIVGSWIFTPILAAIFAIGIYFLVKRIIENSHIHLLKIDNYTRIGLILVGAFGAYSLGMNNIANVMGVFIETSPFQEIQIAGLLNLSSVEQLFLVGGIAIAVGVITYSHRVMSTVGSRIFQLSPVTALIVVLASGLVLFVFASESLREFLIGMGLPAFPLVPVSQSQAVVGAIMGVGLVKGGIHNVNFVTLGRIGLGWIATPVAAGILGFIALFFMENVFMMPVYF